jgi:hypothetical protein
MPIILLSKLKLTFRPILSHECVTEDVSGNIEAVVNTGALALGLGFLSLQNLTRNKNYLLFKELVS